MLALGRCLKTTEFISPIDGIKHIPERTINPMIKRKEGASLIQQCKPQARRASPPIRWRTNSTFCAAKYRSAIGPMNRGAIMAPSGIAA
jgi:hypothetical protein